MTHEDAFLSDIIANPADDAVRLIYADWLDGQGREEYGEFIRVQCEIARLSDCPKIEGHIVEYLPPVNPRLRMAASFVALVNRVDVVLNGPYIVRHQQRDNTWWESEPVNVWKVEEWDTSRVKVVFGEDATIARLCGRERELLRDHSLKWLQGIPFQCIEFKDEGPIPSVACGLASRQSLDSEFYFERGFVYKVRLSCQEWMQHGPALVRRQPIERVVLVDRKPYYNAAGAWIWVMTEGLGHPESAALPKPLYKSLYGFSDVISYIRGYRAAYHTESSALDALSAAALFYARQTEPATARA